MQTELQEELHQEHTTLPCAFVLFKTAKTASIAGQVVWDMSPLSMDVLPAPEVAETIWENLKISLVQRWGLLSGD